MRVRDQTQVLLGAKNGAGGRPCDGGLSPLRASPVLKFRTDEPLGFLRRRLANLLPKVTLYLKEPTPLFDVFRRAGGDLVLLIENGSLEQHVPFKLNAVAVKTVAAFFAPINQGQRDKSA